MNSKILSIGKKFYPQATDQEIMGVWKDIQSKDPNITPEQVEMLLPHLKPEIEKQMAPNVQPLNAPQIQTIQPTVNKMQASPQQPLNLNGLQTALNYKPDMSDEAKKSLQLKALSMIGGR